MERTLHCNCLDLMMGSISGPAPTVLIVEDESLVRILAADVLAEKGLGVIEASHANGALEMLRKHPEVNVLFTDINMPGALDGVDLAWEVSRLWPSVVLLITSGRQGVPIESMPENAMFISKPYDLEGLAQTIHELVLP